MHVRLCTEMSGESRGYQQGLAVCYTPKSRYVRLRAPPPYLFPNPYPAHNPAHAPVSSASSSFLGKKTRKPVQVQNEEKDYDK
jgi:hypothetical protein